MAIAVVSDYPGAQLDQYDQVLAALGHEPGGAGPAGLLFHWATKKGDGVRTVEVWQDREAHDAYTQRVAPAAADAGITQEPERAFIPVHNHLLQG
jgi:quinol monooxygenase YgiN